MKYNKSPLKLLSQLNHIESHYNIKCKDKDLALFYLKHNNYYRLRGYWLYFESKGIKVDFYDVINLYEFDNALRFVLMKYIYTIEISVKSIFAYILSTKYNNPHILLNDKIFKKKEYYNQGIEKLKSSFLESDELFAIHYKNQYDEDLPPVWVCVEFMTFGEISKWIKNLNDRDTKLIAKEYNIKSAHIFKSFLYHLTEIRNKSAHHSRIWNKTFSHKFVIPKQYKTYFDKNFYKLSHSLLVFKILLDKLTNDKFLDEIINLADTYNVPLNEMGINNKILKVLK